MSTIYVNPGENTNEAVRDLPPGGRLVLRSGEHTGFSRTGMSEIVIEGEQNAVINQPPEGKVDLVDISEATALSIRGIIFRDGQRRAIRQHMVTELEVMQCSIERCAGGIQGGMMRRSRWHGNYFIDNGLGTAYSHSLYLAGGRASWGADWEMDGNSITDNVFTNSEDAPASGGSAVHINSDTRQFFTNLEISHNLFIGLRRHSLNICSMDGGRIDNNVFLYDSHHDAVRGAVLSFNASDDNDNIGFQTYARNISVCNNTIVTPVGNAFVIGGFADPELDAVPRGNVFFNNMVVCPGSGNLFYLHNGSDPSHNTYGDNTVIPYDDAGPMFTAFAGDRSLYVDGADALAEVVSGMGMTAENPGVGSGVVVFSGKSCPMEDYFYRSRDSEAIDMGALISAEDASGGWIVDVMLVNGQSLSLDFNTKAQAVTAIGNAMVTALVVEKDGYADFYPASSIDMIRLSENK